MMASRLRVDRRSIAERIISAVLPYIKKHGTPIICKGVLNTARPIKADIAGMEILYLPKHSRLAKCPPLRSLDIYSRVGSRQGKVFSVGIDPFELYRLDMGDWVDVLLQGLSGNEHHHAGIMCMVPNEGGA